jgi:hypothetical protein
MVMMVVMVVVVGMTVIMTMVMEVIVFLYIMNFYREMCTSNATLDTLFCTYYHTGNPQVVYPMQKGIFIGHQFQQRCCQHIASCTHAAINIQCSHFLISI